MMAARSVLKAQPNRYAVMRPAIARQLAKGQYRSALTILQNLPQRGETEPDMLDDMATCYWNLGAHAKAISLVETAAKTLQTDAAAWGKLGAMQLSIGESSAAKASFETALQADPKAVYALVALNRLTPFEKGSHRAETLRKIARSRRRTKAERASAFNAIGHIEARADYPQAAMFHWLKAKALTPGTYDAASVADHVERQCKTDFQPPDPGDAQPRLVFVVGMPRSGTTLVDSILARHPEVTSVGETSALQDCLSTHLASGGGEWTTSLTADAAVKLRDDYFNRIASTQPPSATRIIVDKTPINIFELGFAARILPGACFVFLSRHPLDVGLSNISTHFHAPQPFAKTLNSLGQMTRAIFRSAQDYESKLGASYRWQSYRKLVMEPETEARALLAHLGLDWDPACLRPQDRQDCIATASILQAREPIHTGSLDKWKPYAAHLQPLIDALGGWDWINGWDEDDRRRD